MSYLSKIYPGSFFFDWKGYQMMENRRENVNNHTFEDKRIIIFVLIFLTFLLYKATFQHYLYFKCTLIYVSQLIELFRSLCVLLWFFFIKGWLFAWMLLDHDFLNRYNLKSPFQYFYHYDLEQDCIYFLSSSSLVLLNLFF